MKLTKILGVARGQWQHNLTEADLTNGWKSNRTMTLIRTDDVVSLHVPDIALDGTAKAGDVFLNIPLGYRPTLIGNYGRLGYFDQDGVPKRVTRNFNQLACSGDGFLGGHLLWRTQEAPPPLLLRAFSAVRRLVGWSK